MKKAKDLFEVYTWPEVKYFIQLSEFLNNSILITDKPLIDEYGNSAFLIRKSWIEDLEKNKQE